MLLAAGVLLSIVVVPAGPVPAAEGRAPLSPGAQSVLDWLGALPARAGNRVLSGQFGGYSGNTFGLGQAGQLHAMTGQRPGLLACDYASFGPGTGIDYSCNAGLETWSRDGGLVSVSVHLPSPDPAGGLNTRLEGFGTITDPLSPLGSRWHASLGQVAAGLAGLKAAGVPVLFRPFHEMNGGSFWWSGQDPAEFTRVWRYLTGYMAARGLDNLIWVYAPDAGWGNRATYYPGGAYADVVGVSAYSDNPSGVQGYEELLALGKPFGFTEIGPRTTPEGTATGTFDYGLWAAALHERFPQAAFFQTWDDKWSPQRNQGAAALFADPWLVNRGEISLSARTAATGNRPSGPSTVLSGFEGGAEGWRGYKVKNGPWPVTEWAAQGSRSFKADVDLAVTENYLSTGPLDLRGRTALSVFARTAPWGGHRTGTTAKLYIRTAAVDWRDNGSTTVGPDGAELRLDLSGIPDLGAVREVGVRFENAAGATGQSAVYVDHLTGYGEPKVVAGFEGGSAAGWYGIGVSGGPWALTEWAAQGGYGLKSNVDLGRGESGLATRVPADLRGYTSLSVVARVAPWGDHAAGTTAKLYVKTGAGEVWRDAGRTLVTSAGVTLSVNLTGLPGLEDVRELGVYFQPAPGASGGSSTYLDAVNAW
ncbi:glycosyl hydrolase [Longispora albida]|uniref:glycosyl hydrolase n=1 Tax=Longispora albida TaxID=203523 RepID=UPI00035C77BC|nr:glycosyl hydrolase [Longispora albida]